MAEEAPESVEVTDNSDTLNTKKEPGDASPYAAPHLCTVSEKSEPDTGDARNVSRDKPTPCYLYTHGNAIVDIVDDAK